MSSCVWNVSLPGQLCQGAATLHGQKLLVVLRGIFSRFGSWPLLPVLLLHQEEPVLCCEHTSSAGLLCLQGKGFPKPHLPYKGFPYLILLGNEVASLR